MDNEKKIIRLWPPALEGLMIPDSWLRKIKIGNQRPDAQVIDLAEERRLRKLESQFDQSYHSDFSGL